jgi:hypothetical protein
MPRSRIARRVGYGAARVTAVPRTHTTAIGSALSGCLLTLTTIGWLLVICGALKIVYDLTLLRVFGQLKPLEEADNK